MTLGRAAGRLAVVTLLGLSLLPLANWIPSERSAPWYGATVRDWAIGTAVILVVATLLALGTRTSALGTRRLALGGLLTVFDPARFRALLGVSVLATLLYLGTTAEIFGGRPLLIDEVVNLFQARTYAAGRLWLPVDPDPAFRSILHLVEHQGKWFGHFPPGWPLLLALGELIRAPWVAGPVIGGLTVFAWGLVLRSAEATPSVRAGALLLFALAPFPAFMAASQMSHTAVLLWILLALAGWLGIRREPRLSGALLTGLAFGMAAITRPAEAAAFGVPAAVWALVWAWRTRRIGVLVVIGLAALLPIGFMLAVNQETTGSLWRSGYELLWGPNVGIGFHPAPFGPSHTPVRGLELVSLYLLRLNVYLFETPIPSLLPAALALLMARDLGAVDRYLLSAGVVLLGVYFAYWHDGFFLGPRFVHALAPMLALWTARLPGLVGMRYPGVPRQIAAYGLGLAALGAVAIGIPKRAGLNAALQPGLRFDADRAASRATVSNAVVLVQESWGSTLLARLWALGVSRPDAERYYRNIDSCHLEQALDAAELADAGGILLGDRLAPLLADSAKLRASPFSPDTSERVLQGARYDRRCVARIEEDRHGLALLAPTLLSRRRDLFFARNLHERNSGLLARFPGRSVYLLRQAPLDSVPRFLPLDRDSLLQSR